ncbi:hypothetical protein ACI3L3_15165 [Desulfobaculum sp. SPO524]|uniref:hypothetical protein n=1 Tax=Desulfobaculum sp. SPO524 TaxID=3378071 RepID=UPI0038525C83
MAISSISNASTNGWEVLSADRQKSLANSMKDIQKAKLQREVYADPGMAARLIAIEASPVYNSKGELIPSVGG